MADDLQTAVEKLMAEAYDLVSADRLIAAMIVARKLLKLRYSGAFEIRALVLRKADRMSAALAVLQRGVQKSPTTWILWVMLGNTKSDLKQYDEAFESYERALTIADDIECRIDTQANYAHALRRSGRPLVALEKADWCVKACKTHHIRTGVEAFARSVRDGARADAKPQPRRWFGRKK